MPGLADTARRSDRPADKADFSIFKAFNLPPDEAPAAGGGLNTFNTLVRLAERPSLDGFGEVTPTQANDPRNIQLGFRLSF
jgi:hypothetical protein